jgi:hypothetical protein
MAARREIAREEDAEDSDTLDPTAPLDDVFPAARTLSHPAAARQLPLSLAARSLAPAAPVLAPLEPPPPSSGGLAAEVQRRIEENKALAMQRLRKRQLASSSPGPAGASVEGCVSAAGGG